MRGDFLKLSGRGDINKEGQVTLDKRFGELAIIRNIPHSDIVRLVNISAKKQFSISHAVISRHHDLLENGAIITVEANRIRIRETYQPRAGYQAIHSSRKETQIPDISYKS